MIHEHSISGEQLLSKYLIHFCCLARLELSSAIGKTSEGDLVLADFVEGLVG